MTPATVLLLALTLAQSPAYRTDGALNFPSDYREWIHLSSGLGMTYGPAAPTAMENPRFDNVYVNPPAWKAFKETGHWPDGTIFVLEIRKSTSEGSINKGGFFQTELAAIEVHVKDSTRFPKGSGFFAFGLTTAPAPEMAKEGNRCRACHTANGALDNTFVQFYPIAWDTAKQKGTVKPN